MLTHLARNVDSVLRMMQAAARGEVAWQYAEGQREREIEEGAARPASVLVDDVTRTAADVSRGLGGDRDDVWATGRARVRTGECPVALIPLRRWREVELHHADLGLGFAYDDLSTAYVEREASGVSPPAFGGRDPKGG